LNSLDHGIGLPQDLQEGPLGLDEDWWLSLVSHDIPNISSNWPSRLGFSFFGEDMFEILLK
jgi:hypothetical protein